MQVYTKYYSENNKTNWDTTHKPFIRCVPFTKDACLSYEIGESKNDIIKVHVNGLTFAVIQSKHAEEFVNYFLSQAHIALNIDSDAFIVYDGKELVDEYFNEGARKHEWFK